METDSPAFCVIDAGHSLGHAPGALAMGMAIEKAGVMGVGMGLVKRSNHYGAAGVYATMAADAGMIGMSMTGTSQRSIVPTFAKEPMYSTNPIAFAVPGPNGQHPIVLDMATSTVAVGKLDIARRTGKPLPEGWALTPEGQPRNGRPGGLRRPPPAHDALGRRP